MHVLHPQRTKRAKRQPRHQEAPAARRWRGQPVLRTVRAPPEAMVFRLTCRQNSRKHRCPASAQHGRRHPGPCPGGTGHNARYAFSAGMV